MRKLLGFLAAFILLAPGSLATTGAPSPSVLSQYAPTYVAATALFTPAASATNIVTIGGSSVAGHKIRILRIEFSMTQTTAGQVPIYLIKGSTADTGGTAVAATLVPLDSWNIATTATVNAYTANPTVGTAIGNFMVAEVLVPAPASLYPARSVLYDASLGGQPIVLHGATEQLAINLNGTTPSGAANATATIYFTEENN